MRIIEMHTTGQCQGHVKAFAIQPISNVFFSLLLCRYFWVFLIYLIHFLWYNLTYTSMIAVIRLNRYTDNAHRWDIKTTTFHQIFSLPLDRRFENRQKYLLSEFSDWFWAKISWKYQKIGFSSVDFFCEVEFFAFYTNLDP